MDTRTFLDKYRVSGEQLDGTGEFARTPLIYTAKEIDSEREVSIELIPVGPLKEAERERLVTEATAAKKLHHLNIATLYDFGIEDDHLVYVTEHLNGTVADEWVNANGPLAVGPVLRVASQVVSALYSASTHQIVHSAVNPSNLVLVAGQTADGEWPLVKVLHFVGSPSQSSDTGGPVASFDKSLHYVSPEQIQDGVVDFRTETYSLGCTMWFLLTGVPPSVTAKEPTAIARATTASKVRAIPKRVRRLLGQMLSADPQQRPHDPLELYRSLHDCLTRVERREAVSRRFGVAPFSLPRRRELETTDDIIVPRRRPLKTMAVAALLLGLSAATAFIISSYTGVHGAARAGQPIGVLIGVPTASPAIASNPLQTTSTVPLPDQSPVSAVASRTIASATATPSDVTAALATNSTPTTGTIARSNPSQSAPVEQSTTVASSTSSPPDARIATVSAQPDGGIAQSNDALRPENRSNTTNAPSSVTTSAAQPAAPAVTNRATTANGSSDVASTGQTDTTALSTQSSDTAGHPSTEKEIAKHEVRRAESPEVRRAEPAGPGEGPDTTNSPGMQPGTDGKAFSNEKRSDSKPRAASKSHPTSKRHAKQRRWSNDVIYYPPRSTDDFDEDAPRPQRRAVRARFVGVTPDGMWIMRLPSNRIIVVPPPRSYPED